MRGRKITQKKPLIILIGGKAGSGKNYLADRLTQKLAEIGKETKQLAFATPLKTIVKSVLDLPSIEQVNTLKGMPEKTFKLVETKYGQQHNKTMNVRQMLQFYGDTLKAAVGHDLFVKAALKNVEPDKVNIFTDLRFPEEIKGINKSKYHKVTILVNDGTYHTDPHISEHALRGYRYDYTFHNTDRSNTEKELEQLWDYLCRRIFDNEAAVVRD